MATNKVLRRKELHAFASWEALMLPSAWCSGNMKNMAYAWTVLMVCVAGLCKYEMICSTIIPEVHIAQVFPKVSQDYYAVILSPKRIHRLIYLNRYMCLSTQRNPHDTRITNAFLLDQLRHLFKQLNILVHTEQYLFNWQDHFRHTMCENTFSLEEEWNTVTEGKKYPKF